MRKRIYGQALTSHYVKGVTCYLERVAEELNRNFKHIIECIKKYFALVLIGVAQYIDRTYRMWRFLWHERRD
ncbi:hypothetical protein MCO_01665 [Bartonella sp. DB5-6]|nr:hypothetical protein MCO_01665 [Bartonella sp. DB5-6]